MNPNIKLLVIVAVALAVGTRIFNHLNPWLGLAIILAACIYCIYKFIKQIKDEDII